MNKRTDAHLGLGGEGGVGVVVVHHARARHRHVGHGHDHLRDAAVTRPAAVRHVVDPLGRDEGVPGQPIRSEG